MERIRINGFEGLNPRKDRKNHSWFRVDNSVAYSEALDGLSADQKWFWICLLGHASKKHSDTIDFNAAYFEKHFGVSRKKMDEALTTLKERGAISILDGGAVSDGGGYQPVTARLPGVIGWLPTDRQTDRQTDEPDAESDPTFSPKELAQLWNELAASGEQTPFSAVDIARFKPESARWKSANARLAEEPNQEYWAEVIGKVVSSPFCRGSNDRQWIADFEFLVKPETHLKVRENKYKSTVRGASSDIVER